MCVRHRAKLKHQLLVFMLKYFDLMVTTDTTINIYNNSYEIFFWIIYIPHIYIVHWMPRWCKLLFYNTCQSYLWLCFWLDVHCIWLPVYIKKVSGSLRAHFLPFLTKVYRNYINNNAESGVKNNVSFTVFVLLP